MKEQRGTHRETEAAKISPNRENMSIAALLQAAEYIERRERGNVDLVVTLSFPHNVTGCPRPDGHLLSNNPHENNIYFFGDRRIELTSIFNMWNMKSMYLKYIKNGDNGELRVPYEKLDHLFLSKRKKTFQRRKSWCSVLSATLGHTVSRLPEAGNLDEACYPLH